MSFLEQLAAEWYEFAGYFVRTNPRARKRAKGGWDVELDVLAYDPENRELLHIEASGDANSWQERKDRFMKRKFILTRSEYESIVGASVGAIKKIALVGWSDTTKAELNWAPDIDVVLIPEFLRGVCANLKRRNFAREAVPESFPLLRAIQLALAFNNEGRTVPHILPPRGRARK